MAAFCSKKRFRVCIYKDNPEPEIKIAECVWTKNQWSIYLYIIHIIDYNAEKMPLWGKMSIVIWKQFLIHFITRIFFLQCSIKSPDIFFLLENIVTALKSYWIVDLVFLQGRKRHPPPLRNWKRRRIRETIGEKCEKRPQIGKQVCTIS